MLGLEQFFYTISAERTDIHNSAMTPTLAQHQKAYTFCLPYVKGRRVLEIGCGAGYGTTRLASAAKNILAIDNNQLAIKAAKNPDGQPGHLQFRCLEFTQSSFDTPFEVVIALQVIEHFPDAQVFLKKVNSILTKNGAAVFSTPNADTQSYNENPYHYKEYTPDEWHELLSAFFQEVVIYGLCGNAPVVKYEQERKKMVLGVLKVDIFNLRKLLPRSIRQFASDIATYATRSILNKGSKTYNIGEHDYFINTKTSQAIDLIAVCKNPI